jgi:hypothetical protein
MRYALHAAGSVLMLVLMLAVLGVIGAVSVLTATIVLVVAFRAGGLWAVGAGMVVVGMLAATAVGLLRRRRRLKSRPVGVRVAQDVQPVFWVDINRVAEGLGLRSPDEVLIFPDAKVTASAHRTWLGLRPGVRRLHLGLPLLAALSERELRAVVAHAFARSWGHHSLARVIRHGQRVIGPLADRLGEESLVGRIFVRYRRKYDDVSSPIVLRHELALDRLCADFAGNGATAAALSEVAVLSRGWVAFVGGYAEPAAAVGRRPDDLFAGFTSFLGEPGRREQLAEAAAGPTVEWPPLSDSQMSLADRLAAIALLPEDDIHDKSGPALGLMRYPDQIIRQVEEAMFGGAEFVPETWEDIVPEAACAAAYEDAKQLARLAHEGGLGRTLSVETLLELLKFGFVDEMMRPILTVAPSPEAERQMASRLVTGFLATAAIECGTATYRFSWSVARQLVDEQGAVDDLPLIVDAVLADGSTLAKLKLWLEAHRVGLELELGIDREPATPKPLAVVSGEGATDPSAEVSDPPGYSGADVIGAAPADDPLAVLVPGPRTATS